MTVSYQIVPAARRPGPLAPGGVLIHLGAVELRALSVQMELLGNDGWIAWNCWGGTEVRGTGKGGYTRPRSEIGDLLEIDEIDKIQPDRDNGQGWHPGNGECAASGWYDWISLLIGRGALSWLGRENLFPMVERHTVRRRGNMDGPELGGGRHSAARCQEFGSYVARNINKARNKSGEKHEAVPE